MNCSALVYALSRKRVAQAAVAAAIGCTTKELANKLNGTAGFTFREALIIWKDFAPEVPVDCLLTAGE